MPKDDWAKYARRDRGRRAIASGEYFRCGKATSPARRTKKACGNKKRRVSTACGLTVKYVGDPETATVRFAYGDYSQPLPPWPGFT